MSNAKQIKDRGIIKEWAKNNLAGNSYRSKIGLIAITITGIKEAINQPHKQEWAKNNSLYLLPSMLYKAKHVSSAKDIKGM